jgi:hypothetical protein
MSVDIAANLTRVRDEINRACLRVGRDPRSVTLIAVSKTHPANIVMQAIGADATHFGENRVEEAETKIPLVRQAILKPVTWHMIGHLQSRKAKDAVALFDVIHSVDTLKLGDKLSRHAEEMERTIEIMMEFNLSGEVNKYGLAARDWQTNAENRLALFDITRQFVRLPNLRLVGLMTMAPIVTDMEEARPIFAGLAQLRDAIQSEIGTALPELSMGMTDDYPVAIEEGATLVRIGRAIFGERATHIEG